MFYMNYFNFNQPELKKTINRLDSKLKSLSEQQFNQVYQDKIDGKILSSIPYNLK